MFPSGEQGQANTLLNKNKIAVRLIGSNNRSFQQWLPSWRAGHVRLLGAFTAKARLDATPPEPAHA